MHRMSFLEKKTGVKMHFLCEDAVEYGWHAFGNLKNFSMSK